MKKYNIDKAHVVRHFDVTGKACPAYWVDDKKWKKEFLDKLQLDDTKDDTKINNPINKPFYNFCMRVRLPSSPLKKVLK